MGYKVEAKDLTSGDGLDPRRDFDYPDGDTRIPEEVRLTYRHEYIGVPIALRYWSTAGKWRFAGSLGCTASYLIQARLSSLLLYEGDGRKRSSQASIVDYEPFNLIPFLSLGLDYQLNDKMRLSAMPSARYGLLNIHDAPISGRIYSAGLQLGWAMDLNGGAQ